MPEASEPGIPVEMYKTTTNSPDVRGQVLHKLYGEPLQVSEYYDVKFGVSKALSLHNAADKKRFDGGKNFSIETMDFHTGHRYRIRLIRRIAPKIVNGVQAGRVY